MTGVQTCALPIWIPLIMKKLLDGNLIHANALTVTGKKMHKKYYWEENIAGINIKNINGLVTPPVKNNKTPNCNVS